MRRDEILSLAAGFSSSYRICPPERLGRGVAGVFGGSRDGQSVDFHDFRNYHPGDDLRRVDWRGYARSGKMHLKLFREETSPVVELILDTSASMGAYTGKEQGAAFIAAFLHGAVLSAEGRPVLCRDGGRFFGGDFLPALLGTEFMGDGDMPSVPAASPGGNVVRFLISDFLYENGVQAALSRCAAGSAIFSPIMVLSRSECDPGWRGYHRLVDVECPDSTADLAITDDVVSAYRTRLNKHREAIALAAHRHGGRLLTIDTPDGELDKAACGAIVEKLAAERVVTPR